MSRSSACCGHTVQSPTWRTACHDHTNSARMASLRTSSTLIPSEREPEMLAVKSWSEQATVDAFATGCTTPPGLSSSAARHLVVFAARMYAHAASATTTATRMGKLCPAYVRMVRRMSGPAFMRPAYVRMVNRGREASPCSARVRCRTPAARATTLATLALDITVTSVQRSPTASLPAPTHGPRG